MDYLLPNSLPTGVFAAAEALDFVGLARPAKFSPDAALPECYGENAER